ncbi:hypothetical protein niasHT_037428 [Heterodera trifolii]|uniref:Uncharacterized protein n=1 Tax=Heterodera trifolii TaxID=157864 RepID=A0ABD2J0Q2_9BILA
MSVESFSSDFQQQKKVVDQYVSKLERPLKHVLSHEFGNGSLCNRCDCPGLDLHFWRKICKNCSCRLDEHDILLPNEQDHGTIVARKLFDRSQQKNFSGSSSVSSLSTNNSSSPSRDSPENLLKLFDRSQQKHFSGSSSILLYQPITRRLRRKIHLKS